MGFVGLARDEDTYEPRAYMESLPRDLTGLPVLVLDPMLATGGSLEHCCRLLADRGCTDITVLCVLAAPVGIERLERSGLPLRLVTASIDERPQRPDVHRPRPRRRRRPPVRRHAPLLSVRRRRLSPGGSAGRVRGRPRGPAPSGAVDAGFGPPRRVRDAGCARRYRSGP